MEGIDIENLPHDDYKIPIKTIFAKVVWTDVPIMITIGIYIVLLVLALKFRKNKTWRTVLFAICLIFVFFVEKMTAYFQKNWKLFGFSDNYFDDFGVFAAFFYALPPLFIAIILFSTLIGNIAEKLIQRHMLLKQQEKKLKEENEAETKGEEQKKDEEQETAKNEEEEKKENEAGEGKIE